MTAWPTDDGRALTESPACTKTAGPGRQLIGQPLLRKTDAVPGGRCPPCLGRPGRLGTLAGSGNNGVVRLLLGGLFDDPRIIGPRWRPLESMSLLFGKGYVSIGKPRNGGRAPVS